MKQIIRIGTRKSMLALAQAEMVAEGIKKNNPDMETELVPMSTIGDKILDKPLDSFGGKGAFISEFEDAILSGKIDIAVHSAKDMPIVIPEGLGILAVSKREDPRDVIIQNKNKVKKLDDKFIMGTGSLRRQLQIQDQYQVMVKNLRGNVNTRLNKLKESEYDGIILAAAGLKRLKLEEEEGFAYQYLDTESFIPSAGQGIIAVEGRNDSNLRDILKPWNDLASYYCLETEREVLWLLDAGCNEPIGVFSNVEKGYITLRILYVYDDRIIRVSGKEDVKDRFELAKNLVEKVMMATRRTL
jgi:hydroxymethylbilane synthase/uroporphyrinogen III methyltransferase/synthase